jgi:hypothetical protein
MRRSKACAVVVLVACAGATTRGPELTAPDTTSAALARIARQCALVASCADEHDSSVFRTPQSCVDWYAVNARDEAPLADCLMNVKSCADMTTCTHARADAAAESFCKSHPGVQTTCDGNALFTCEGEGGEESTALDCRTLDGTCGEHNTGGLVVRGCVSPRLCPPGSPEHRCDNEARSRADTPKGTPVLEAVIDCEDGVAEKNACPKGSRCVPGTDAYGAPTAHCRSASGRECSVGGGAFCEGDVAYVCVQNGRFAGLHTADCGALGLGCVVRSGHVSCVRRGPAACSTEPATCAAGELRFCAAGEPFHVPCRELGFSGCDPAGGGGEALCTSHVR